MAFLHSDDSFISRTERSPCSQAAWRKSTDVTLNFFRKIAAVQNFVLDLLTRETVSGSMNPANRPKCRQSQLRAHNDEIVLVLQRISASRERSWYSRFN
jgi:hypothetical protein